MRPSSYSPSALSTVKHVIIALTFDCSHRFMEPLDKLKILMYVTLLFRGSCDFTNMGGTGRNLCNIINTGIMAPVLLWNFILLFSQTTSLTWSSFFFFASSAVHHEALKLQSICTFYSQACDDCTDSWLCL